MICRNSAVLTRGCCRAGQSDVCSFNQQPNQFLKLTTDLHLLRTKILELLEPSLPHQQLHNKNMRSLIIATVIAWPYLRRFSCLGSDQSGCPPQINSCWGQQGITAFNRSLTLPLALQRTLNLVSSQSWHTKDKAYKTCHSSLYSFTRPHYCNPQPHTPIPLQILLGACQHSVLHLIELCHLVELCHHKKKFVDACIHTFLKIILKDQKWQDIFGLLVSFSEPKCLLCIHSHCHLD